MPKELRTVQVTVLVCDLCGKEDSGGYECLVCHKVVCYDCGLQLKNFVEYRGHANGGGYFNDDGHVCVPCNQTVTDHPVLNAYRRVERIWRNRSKMLEQVKALAAIAEVQLQQKIHEASEEKNGSV